MQTVVLASSSTVVIVQKRMFSLAAPQGAGINFFKLPIAVGMVETATDGCPLFRVQSFRKQCRVRNNSDVLDVNALREPNPLKSIW